MSLPLFMRTVKLLHWKHLMWMLLMLTGCNIINPDEDPPSYIKIDSFSFNPTPTINEMGPSTSTKIRDVWVYVDYTFQGAYELPVRFPVLNTGSHQVTLSPGIALNGISSTRSPYPFYKGLTEIMDLPPNGEVVINPSISYFETVKCNYCEDFENVGFSLTSTDNSDTIMHQLPPGDPDIKEGNGSGVVYLDNVGTRFELTSTTAYDLPGSGAAVFLELDYKINQAMNVGVFINTPGIAQQAEGLIVLNPTETWNKIYIQMGYTISRFPNAENFQIFFSAAKDPSVTKSEFYLDNIKVVSF